MKEDHFDFWRAHSMRYLEMAFRTDKCELRGPPDAQGEHTGECGDSIEMFIKVAGDRVQWVAFKVDGCLNTLACANTVAHLAKGRRLVHAWELTPEMVVAYLETLPPDDTHCAELAVGAFYRALTDFQKKKKEPQKKLYQV